MWDNHSAFHFARTIPTLANIYTQIDEYVQKYQYLVYKLIMFTDIRTLSYDFIPNFITIEITYLRKQ